MFENFINKFIFILGEEIKQQYQQLAQALDEYVRKTFNEWTTTVDKDTSNLLDVPLMCRSTQQLGMLELNFDRYSFSVCLNIRSNKLLKNSL